MDVIFLSLYQYFQAHKGRLLILVTVLVLGCMALIGSRLQLDENIAKVIPFNADIRKVNAAYQNTKFSDNLIFHLSWADSSAAEDTPRFLAFADSLVAALRQLDSSRIQEIRYTLDQRAATALYHLFYEQLPVFLSESDYTTIAERLDSNSVKKALRSVYKTLLSPTGFVLKKQVLSDPLGLASLPLLRLRDFQIDGNYTLHEGRIVTQDKKDLLFFVTPTTDAGATGENAQLLAQIDTVLARVTTDFKQTFRAEYFGSIAVSVANAQQIQRDIAYTVGAALVVLLLFIALFFRRLSTPLLIFVPVVIGALVGLASLVLLKDSISAISLGVGAILLGIAVDFSLHVFTHFRAEGNVRQTIKAIATPTVVSSLTSSSAFLCLLYLSSEALRDLGFFAAVAVLVSALMALLLLPHFLKDKTASAQMPRKSILDKIAAYPLHANRWVFGGVVVLSLGFLFLYQDVAFEEDMNSISYQTPALKAADERLQELGGEALKSSYVVASSTDLQEALERNEQVLATLQQLRAQGRIQNYTSVSHFIPSEQAQRQRIARWNAFWTPARKVQLQRLLKQQGAVYKFKPNTFEGVHQWLERDFEPVPFTYFQPLQELVLDQYSTAKENQYAFISIIKMDDAHKKAVYRRFEGSEQISVFDKQFMAEQFAQSLQDDFGMLVNWSFLVVFLLLLLAFGRLELALLTLFPIVLSWEWTLAWMVVLGLKFNLVNIIICTFIFGLGIDYSIFVTKGLLHEYQFGERILPAYKTSILLSALTTLCGMGVMIFAQHPALFSIASLSIIGLLSILLITFTLQPRLFGFFILNRKKKGLPPYTLLSLISTAVAYAHFLSGCLLLTLLQGLLRLLPLPLQFKKDFFHKHIQLLSRSLIHLMFNVRKRYLNRHHAQLDRPAVIIANHQSFLDIMMLLMLHPKIIIMTNEWVWNSPIFGQVIRFADFYPSKSGAEQSLEHLRDLTEQGYSIVIFPEGTRSITGDLKRFKKGAFYIAEQLQLDILPIVFHGTGDCIRKKDFLVHGTTVTMQFLERIAPSDVQWGEGYSKRAKTLSRHFKTQYEALRQRQETPAFFHNRLIKNYIYKGPILEWYARIKVRLENNYQQFHELLPREGHLVDIGCGYGFMSNMLYLLARQRTILGLDYDAEKIRVAQEGYLRQEQVQFAVADVSAYDLPESAAFILSDVLHYLTPEEQENLLQRCVQRLQPGGLLLIRDGDSDLQERHENTLWTEHFSTKIFSFNKVDRAQLTFFSGTWLADFAQRHNLHLERREVSTKTSNVLFILTPTTSF
jgi:1-acyl-sn-glycerol-3-phosphate acyltransferase